MTWWKQFVQLLTRLLPKHYPLPVLDTTFKEQAVRRAKQHRRWCETCEIGFRTTAEFHDHTGFTGHH